MKQLKKFLITCFVISLATAIAFNMDGDDGDKNIGSIGWLVLAAACILSYTRIVVEENRNKK